MTPEGIHVAAELTAWLVLSFATVIAAVVAYGFRRVATMYAHRADEVKQKYEQELERVLAAFETHQRALRRVERDRGHWRESFGREVADEGAAPGCAPVATGSTAE